MNYSDKYGKWALVVGASAGLGAAWAEECAKHGMNVILCARRLNKLEEVSDYLHKKYSIETKVLAADISKEETASEIIHAINGLDVGMFIYNAAIEMAGQFIKTKEENHLKMIVGNVITPTKISYYISREMAKKHRGCILLLSSMSASAGTSCQSTYSASKAYLMQLAETLWYEMGKYGVYAAGVMVGSIVTPEFIRQQSEQGTNMSAGGTYSIENLISDLKVEPACLSAAPHTPEEAAAYVMEHLEEGPRLYTHPEDRASNEGYGRMNRKDATLLLSRITDAYFSAGHDEQMTADALEFEEIKSM